MNKRNKPHHDKTNKVNVRPAKTLISLGIRPDWSESSMCASWVAKDPSFLHADSEDSDQTGRMPRLIWVFAGRTVTLLVCHVAAQIQTANMAGLDSSLYCVENMFNRKWQERNIGVYILRFIPLHFIPLQKRYIYMNRQCSGTDTTAFQILPAGDIRRDRQ